MATTQAPAMTPAKPWYKHGTLWGLIIALIGLAVHQFLGVEIPDMPANADAEQLKLYYERVNAAKGDTASLVGIALEFVGFAFAFYKKIVSTTQVTLTSAKAEDINNRVLEMAMSGKTAGDVGLSIPKSTVVNSNTSTTVPQSLMSS